MCDRFCIFANGILNSFFLALFRVVSAVLQFGNMVFKQERSSEQAIMPSNEGQPFFLCIWFRLCTITYKI